MSTPRVVVSSDRRALIIRELAEPKAFGGDLAAATNLFSQGRNFEWA
jgi:hypothetical protein